MADTLKCFVFFLLVLESLVPCRISTLYSYTYTWRTENLISVNKSFVLSAFQDTVNIYVLKRLKSHTKKSTILTEFIQLLLHHGGSICHWGGFLKPFKRQESVHCWGARSFITHVHFKNKHVLRHRWNNMLWDFIS